ncbi:MAG: biotin carboxylase N-terminal domain-containing protein, partial [Candidatus Limnocylindrales bacterium]
MRKDSLGGGMTVPFRRVLVANRGEIALRIVRTLQEAGVEAVAVYSDADSRARHVRAADHAVRIGPPPAAGSYLRVDNILDAARASQADAVHPGYGFLSEQAAFATACADAGMVFIGPSPETLAGLGDKIAARRSANASGVPVVPGTFEALELNGMDDAKGMDPLSTVAAGIGWPLLVKASAGGGGRGMRRVDDSKDFPAAVASAAREGKAAFGDGTIYLERYIEQARHVEVQLLGDSAGSIVALGERDCSVQRRHQKLVEEGPAPGLTEAQRERLHGLAVTVARSVGLQNAATAEFLLAPDGQLYFLEINARLQVEHGVTELVTGLDLVREQLWLA